MGYNNMDIGKDHLFVLPVIIKRHLSEELPDSLLLLLHSLFYPLHQACGTLGFWLPFFKTTIQRQFPQGD